MNTRDITDKMQDWQKVAGEKARLAGRKARDWGQNTDEYVRDNTWMAIGIAALVGCVFGLLLSRRGED